MVSEGKEYVGVVIEAKRDSGLLYCRKLPQLIEFNLRDAVGLLLFQHIYLTLTPF